MNGSCRPGTFDSDRLGIDYLLSFLLSQFFPSQYFARASGPRQTLYRKYCAERQLPLSGMVTVRSFCTMGNSFVSHTMWIGKWTAMGRKKSSWTYIAYMDRSGAQPLPWFVQVLFDRSEHPIDGFGPWPFGHRCVQRQLQSRSFGQIASTECLRSARAIMQRLHKLHFAIAFA